MRADDKSTVNKINIKAQTKTNNLENLAKLDNYVQGKHRFFIDILLVHDYVFL